MKNLRGIMNITKMYLLWETGSPVSRTVGESLVTSILLEYHRPTLIFSSHPQPHTHTCKHSSHSNKITSCKKSIEQLKLPTLSLTRKVRDLMQAIKIIHGYGKIPVERFFLLSNTKPRGHKRAGQTPDLQ